ncbi:MAG: TIGR03089 family protein [Beutenbergiaceae bacterium]
MRTPAVLATLDSWEPSAPRLTWYGAADERIDLSGRVLRNWVVKAANLLMLDADTDADSVLLIDLPGHWRQLVWCLAAWELGVQPLLADGHSSSSQHDGVDIVLTSRPHHWGETATVVAIALPALARSWESDLPAGAIDGAAELMGQGDEPAFTPSRGPVPEHRPARVLLTTDAPLDLPQQAWQIWEHGGSIVLATSRDRQQLAAIADQERALAP